MREREMYFKETSHSLSYASLSSPSSHVGRVKANACHFFPFIEVHSHT